jgi:hypothetical protein
MPASYQAKSWNTDRRACARIEATTKGLDIRFVVTSIETGSAGYIYKRSTAPEAKPRT